VNVHWPVRPLNCKNKFSVRDMPVTYTIDRESRVVYSLFSGVFTDADVWQLIDALRKNPEYDPDFDELIDCSAVTENRVTAATLGSVQSSSIPRRAVVAPSNANYGVSRIFQALQSKQKIEVFRTLADAEQWLGIGQEGRTPKTETKIPK
jgi:hypothetical protein